MNQLKSNLPQEAPTLSIRGVDLWESWLSPVKQRQILEDIRAVVTKAPLFEPVTPAGKKMSVCMTSAGRLGWVGDRSGFRLAVTSREVVRLFLEQVRFEFVPMFHCL